MNRLLKHSLVPTIRVMGCEFSTAQLVLTFSKTTQLMLSWAHQTDIYANAA